MVELLYLFIVGAVFGSFLNVVVDRLPLGQSIVTGRSYCDSCKKTILWQDLIPVLSYIHLRGKCRFCHQSIGLYYPIVEVVTGILFALAALWVTSLVGLVFTLIILSTLVIIFFADMKYGIIPFPAVFFGVIAVLLKLLLLTPDLFVSSILAALGAGAFFLIIFLATKGRGMGFGDVVYALYMGFLLGYPYIIFGLYLGFLTGALLSLILILRGKKRLKGDTIPFGPFLVFGTVIALLYGNEIAKVVNAYIHIG